MSFHLFEDFHVHDQAWQSYQIDIEAHTSYSHKHARIFESDGLYRVMLNGNRHFLTSPALQNFRLEMNFALILPNHDWGYGFKVFFRHNRSASKGRLLEFRWSPEHVLQVKVDDTVMAQKTANAAPDLTNCRLVFAVTGELAALVFNDDVYTFTLPARKDLPKAGSVGFDLGFAPSSYMTVSQIVLDSDDPLSRKPLGRRMQFVLPGAQGNTEPLEYTFEASSWPDGTVLLECTLAGSIQDRQAKPKIANGFSFELDTLKEPYLRIEADGQEFKNILLANDTMLLFDSLDDRLGRKLHPVIAWPLQRTLVCRKFPRKFIVAAGYQYHSHSPWPFAANGPYEQIRDMNGNLLYEGMTLRGSHVAVAVKSPEDKKIVSRIPVTVVDYDKALAHAKREHFFYEDEKPSFTVSIWFRETLYQAGEFSLEVSVQDPFERAIPDCTCAVTEIPAEPAVDRMQVLVRQLKLGKPLKNGIYHLFVKVTVDGKIAYDDFTVFEVLPEDPAGLPPPVAAGLPVMLAMPNEIGSLETDAFDPYHGRGGAGHYYTISMRYPAIAARERTWELLHLYHRKWFLMLTNRNSLDITLSDTNRALIGQADFLDISDADRQIVSPAYTFSTPFYNKWVLYILKDFLLESGTTLTLTSPTVIDRMIEENQRISPQQLAELTDVAWEAWNQFFEKRAAGVSRKFFDRVLAVNPKIARASYGPVAIYGTSYKSAEAVRTSYNGTLVDPVTNANGSIFLLEDYHYSCGYPLSAASFFVSTYCLMYDNRRLIYPEVYFGGGLGCGDGAVYQAHPPLGIYKLRASHQRCVVYGFTYGTPFFKNGQYDYWRDAGFHYRTPGKDDFRHFLHAWGNLLRNRPAKPLPAAALVTDPSLIRLHKSFCDIERSCYSIPNYPSWGDVFNTADEDTAFAFDEITAGGFNSPVVMLAKDIDNLDPDNTPFLVLPPIVKDTPGEVIVAVRNAHKRGINLLAFEEVAGLEDLFGVKLLPAPVVVRSVAGEAVDHPLAVARYEATDAQAILSGAEQNGQKEILPMMLTKKTRYGLTAFVNIPPTVVRREDFRQKLGYGYKTLSGPIREAFRRVIQFLHETPAVQTERGGITACTTINGDLVVTLQDVSSTYGDTTEYPATFRFQIRHPGIGKRSVESDSVYSFVEQEDDSVLIRTEIDKDTALFFRFHQEAAPTPKKNGAP